MRKPFATLEIHRVQAIAGLVLAVAMLWLLWMLAVTPSQGAKSDLPGHPRLESVLQDLVAAHTTGGAAAAASFAARHGVTLVGGLVRVVLVCEAETDQAASARQITALGGQVEAVYGPWSQGLLPVEALPTLANTPGVRFVRRPWLPSLATTSEGVAVTAADEWQEAGYTGQGVKVGVLDLGFLDYTDRISEGELPSDVITRSFAGDEGDFGRGTQHGTACAEVVHDMSPGARLYLVNFSTESEWANAINWLMDQDVDVISFSAGWPVGGPGDGTGKLSVLVEDVQNAGILWVNAAGNSARQHWMGLWNDPEENGWHNYSSTDETNEITVSGGLPIVIGLRWDDPWGASANDYDLFLFRGSDPSPVAESINWQTGDGDPLEFIHIPGGLPADIYRVAISKQPGAETRTLELFSYYHDFHYQTASSSLVVPADSRGSLTVGATYWWDDALEAFSSQGPTRDGRVKPDLAAPDGVSVSSETWRYSGFYGTSASAPHVVGAAALVLEAFPAFTPAQTQSWLEDRAVDFGASGKDNAFGVGRLNLPAEISAVAPAAVLQGATVTLQVTGVPFASTATFFLTKPGYEDILPSDVSWVSVSQLTGTVNLSGIPLGFWTVVVANTPSFSMSLPDAFLVASDRAYLPLVVKDGLP